MSHYVLPTQTKNKKENSPPLDCYSLADVIPCQSTNHVGCQAYAIGRLHRGLAISEVQRRLHCRFAAVKVHFTTDNNNMHLRQNRDLSRAK